MTKPSPCPFCAASNGLHVRRALDSKGIFTYIECDSCGAKGPPTREEHSFEAGLAAAVHKWNLRATEN